MGKKALILSGGSVKGAFQAGAIAHVLQEGFKPDIIHGISVGALNGSFMVNETGKQPEPMSGVALGHLLVQFWINQIKSPRSLVKKVSKFKLMKQLLFNQFDGLLDTAPLQQLVHGMLSEEALRNSSIDFSVGAVDMISGKIKYFNALDPNIIEGVIASAAIPIVMPLSNIGNTIYYDGGLRDVAPVNNVIEKGADEIVIILCQAEELSAKNFNSTNLSHLLERSMEIVVNEAVNADIKQLERINSSIPSNGHLFDKKPIRYRIIRLQSELTVKINAFNVKDIQGMVDLGKRTAQHTPWRN